MKKTVVLIQDNPVILEIMDQVLTEEGFAVTPSLTTWIAWKKYLIKN